MEIKPNNKTLNTARVLLQTLKKHDFVSATVIASFDYLVLKQIKAEYDNSHIAAIKIPGDYVLPSELKKQFSIEAYVCAVDEINDQIVENIKTNNIFWGVYNVDSEEDFQKAIKSGVNAIGTNFPCQMNKLLEKLNGI